MDVGDSGTTQKAVTGDDNQQSSSSSIHLSDVIATIENDQSYVEAPLVEEKETTVQTLTVQQQAPLIPSIQQLNSEMTTSLNMAQYQQPINAYVEITEQPAPKALRFRYVCEGRSAGAIPGVNSRPNNKTFPSIRINGFKGNAIVVVSCVTADGPPYRPHPHNLVGKDSCKKGICTMVINSETMTATFSNLGIQCVKKNDIEEALQERKNNRVDPFKTGYDHKPGSIDLNCVRLCFQVFLALDGGKARYPLPPVVSDIIYDKKAMNDLVIVRLSTCAVPASGGTEVILLCEKVAKEDITVYVVEMHDDQIVWEQAAEMLLVHKQVAIAFRAPQYRDADIEHPVRTYIQLRKPSDKNTVSELFAFEYIPTDEGKKHYEKLNRKLLADIKCSTTASIGSEDINNNKEIPTEEALVKTSSYSSEYTNGNVVKDNSSDGGESGVSKLLDQVAELDEIYSENRTRIENLASLERKELESATFDDSCTYTSLQLAFKNPVRINTLGTSYEDIMAPITRTIMLKEEDEEKLPPLPPKRSRNHETNSLGGVPISSNEAETLLHPVGEPKTPSRTTSIRTLRQTTPPKEEAPKEKPKKRSFLSRLFRRNKKKQTPPSTPAENHSSRPVGRSVSSVSGRRPARFHKTGTHSSHLSLPDSCGGNSMGAVSYADSVTHISLHESPLHSRRSIPADMAAEGKILVAESVLALDAETWEKLKAELELQETDQYALYVSDAPRATLSECDDLSQFYAKP